MSGINYKESYWDQALEVLEIEENWIDALAVLKKAERKAAFYKAVPALAILALLATVYASALFSLNSEALSLKETQSPWYISESMERVNSSNANFSTSIENSESSISIETSAKDKSNIHYSTRTIGVADGEQNNSHDIIKETESNNNHTDILFTTDDKSLEEKTDIATIDETSNKAKMDDFSMDNGVLMKKKFIQSKNQNIKSHIPANRITMNFLPMLSPTSVLVKAKLFGEKTNLMPRYSFRKSAWKLVLASSQLTGYGSNGEKFVNPEFGIEYEYGLTNNISINAGLTYFTIEGLNHKFESTETEFGFGIKETTRTFISNKIHYLHVPFDMEFKFNAYHSISAGVGVSYLLSNNSSIETAVVEDGTFSGSNNSSEKGFTEGYKSFVPSINAGYGFAINARTEFGISYQYGLSAITKDEFYDSETRDKNSRLRIALKRTIR